MKLFSIIMLFMSSLGLSSCIATSNYPAQQKPAPVDNSMSGRWFLTSLNNAGYQGPRITLQFTGDNKINGFSGCNRYFGPANRGMNGDISFERIASTKKACFNQQNNRLEYNYLSALSRVQSYQLSGNRLVLNGPSTHLVFYKKGFR